MGILILITWWLYGVNGWQFRDHCKQLIMTHGESQDGITAHVCTCQDVKCVDKENGDDWQPPMRGDGVAIPVTVVGSPVFRMALRISITMIFSINMSWGQVGILVLITRWLQGVSGHFGWGWGGGWGDYRATLGRLLFPTECMLVQLLWTIIIMSNNVIGCSCVSTAKVISINAFHCSIGCCNARIPSVELMSALCCLLRLAHSSALPRTLHCIRESRNHVY